MSNIFRAYDIRGIYPEEINTDIAKRVGNALVRYLKTPLTSSGQAKTVVVGEDGRIGSPELRHAVTEGITSAGADVIYLGQCTTPLFYFAVNRLKADGGVMVTASHNPAQYNGLKFVGPGSIPIASDSGLLEIEKLSENLVTADKRGEIREVNMVNDYVDEVIRLSGRFKTDLKIVLDASNGITSVTSKPLLDKLGISFIPLNFDIDGSFPNHSPDTSKEENLEQLKKAVLDNGADLGFAFDGDGDRISFVDKSGEYIRPDYILALLFKDGSGFFKKPKAVYDLRFTKSVRDYLGKNGLRCKVGYTFIKRLMRETHAELGAELAGHFYMKEMNYSEAASLIMLKVLKIVNREKKQRHPYNYTQNPEENRMAAGPGTSRFTHLNRNKTLLHKISGVSGFALVLLVLVLVGLGERVLYDLSRVFVGPGFSYFNDLSTLLVHTLFVMLLIVVAVVVNVLVAERKEKYAIVLIPYFVLAIALTIQVALEAAVYFYFHHTQFQFYLVMSTLVIVSSMLIYFVQKRFVPVEMSEPAGSGSGGHSIFFWVLGVIIGVPLLLYVLAMFFFRAFW